MSFDLSPQTAQTRTLVVHSKKLPWWLMGLVEPVVLLDGREFPLGWGTQTFTIPADQRVHVQCLMPHVWAYGKAEMVVEPSYEAEVEYSPPSSRLSAGEMGPPGTTKSRGTGISYGVYGLAGLMMMGAIVGIVILVWQR